MERLSNLRQVLGKKLFDKVENSRILMVGSGGIGCELLKNLVMSGFKNIEIIDLDTIDLSNLNRQFLFQKQHIGKSKSKVARQSALEFNPNVNIIAHHANIKDPQFNIKWFKSFDIVMNALDNLDARRHVNTMCLAANVPLIESGTSGYTGQATVIKKNVTECYECQPKPTPKTFPICTIRSTPSTPIHCIVWAKNYLFAELFGKSEDNGDEINAEVTEENNKEIENLKKESQALKELFKLAGKSEYSEKVFNKVFNLDILRLLKMENLWKTRTKPVPINNEQYKKSLEANMEVDDNKDDSKTKDNQKIYTLGENINIFKNCFEILVQRQLKGKEVDPDFSMSFEKDDDIIMKFVAATANIRAHIFHIEQLNRFKIKEIAGNIIPSIATTNAIISGVIIMDAYKILNDQLEDCNTIFLTRDSSNVFANEFLAKPNPRCAVCRKSYFVLSVNIEKFTLNDLLNKVLMGPKDKNGLALEGDITICEDQRILYDFDFDDKLNDTFSKVKIEDGKYLNITCDDDDKMYNIMVYIINDSSLDKDYKLEGDKDSISYILPQEKEEEPEIINTNNKRKERDDNDSDSNKKPKVISVDIVDDDDKEEIVILD